MLGMRLKHLGVLLTIAFVAGVLLGIASHSHPGITNTLWVFTPYVILMLLVAFVLPCFSDSDNDTRIAMRNVYIFVMAWAALCVGYAIGSSF